jgi:hypothetical protein
MNISQGEQSNESVGIQAALKSAPAMKKNTQILKNRQKLSLGDLILAVSSCTKNTKETVAAVADLLGSGQVRLQSNGRSTRARVC